MIISYGTTKRHGESIKRLKKSCESLGFPNYIIEIPDSFFSENRFKYLYKPIFIRETLEKFNRPVIWMDADSLLVKIPFIGELNFDFGYVKSPPGSHKWFADSCHVHTPKNIPFLHIWESFCAEEKGKSDHTQLIRAYNCMKEYDYFSSRDISDWFKNCYIRNYKGHGEIHY